MNVQTKKYGYGCLVVALFITFYFAVRVPLLNEPLGIEEGIFAEIIVNRPVGPLYSLTGRIDGENIYSYISHPAPSYELLRLGGAVFQKWFTNDTYLNDSLVVPRLRTVCSLYQLALFGVLLLFVLYDRSINQKWSVLLLFVMALSPLTVKTSVFLQIDNTSGVLLCGGAAFLCMVANLKETSFSKRFLLLLAAGLIAGLGKQEWSFAFLAALLVMLLLTPLGFLQLESSRQNIMIMLGCCGAGLIAGNIISYLYDPKNYLLGLDYIVYFSKLHETSAGQWNIAHWLGLMKTRLPFIYSCFLLEYIIITGMIQRQRLTVPFMLIVLYGSFLLLGYIASDWISDPRYFAPCLAVLTPAAFIAIPAQLPLWNQRVIGALFISVLLTTVIFLIGRKPNANRDWQAWYQQYRKVNPDSVLFIKSGEGWNKMGIDYYNSNAMYEGAQKRVLEKYHKQLIIPEDGD